MFWISSSFSEHISQVDIFPLFSSDHSYVFSELSFPSLPERGLGVFKLNTSLLKDDTLVQDVRDFWTSWHAEKLSFFSWWDTGKAHHKTFLRKRSREKACSRRNRVTLLENDLAQLHVRENQGENVSHLIKDVKAQLELEHLHAAEGERVRA